MAKKLKDTFDFADIKTLKYFRCNGNYSCTTNSEALTRLAEDTRKAGFEIHADIILNHAKEIKNTEQDAIDWFEGYLNGETVECFEKNKFQIHVRYNVTGTE